MLHAGDADAAGKSKIEPFIDSLCKQFTEVYTPTPFVSIDEMIIGFKGRWKFKQFNASKPHKYHIKSFGLVDSSNGFVLDLLVYFGKETSYASFTDVKSGAAIKVFDKLLQSIGTGYHIFADRWYTTRALVDDLLLKSQYYTGTINVNRVGFPPHLKNLRIDHMESKHYATNDKKLIVCAFKDKKAKKPAILVSTNSKVDEVVNYRGKSKPAIVDQYNTFMSGCDRADQMIGYYGHHNRKSTKWWKKLFFWILEITTLNAFILYKSSRPRPFKHGVERHLTFLNFKKKMISQMETHAVQIEIARGTSGRFQKPVGRPLKNTAIEINTPGKHIIEKGGQQRVCKQCSSTDSPKRTVYYCKTCPSHPHVHPCCFANIHKR